jgi:hypothetical protein
MWRLTSAGMWHRIVWLTEPFVRTNLLPPSSGHKSRHTTYEDAAAGCSESSAQKIQTPWITQRKNTTFTTRWKFEIKRSREVLKTGVEVSSEMCVLLYRITRFINTCLSDNRPASLGLPQLLQSVPGPCVTPFTEQTFSVTDSALRCSGLSQYWPLYM